MAGDRDVTTTLEHAQPAAGDQPRGLGEELRAVEAIRAPCEDQGLQAGPAGYQRMLDCVFVGSNVELHIYQECTASFVCRAVNVQLVS